MTTAKKLSEIAEEPDTYRVDGMSHLGSIAFRKNEQTFIQDTNEYGSRVKPLTSRLNESKYIEYDRIRNTSQLYS